MAIGDTNRIHDPNKERAYQLRYELQKKEVYKGHAQSRKKLGAYKHFKVKAATCDKCKRGMRPDIARTQLENKENILEWHGHVPICLACINGFKRKPLKHDKHKNN